jgi:hypothetical protein
MDAYKVHIVYSAIAYSTGFGVGIALLYC